MFGPIMSVAIICGNVVSIIVYVLAYIFGKTHRISGNIVYDFFMGAWLNPLIGNLDLKMWVEIRVSWILLFLLTTSAEVKQYESLGYISMHM